MPVHLYGQPADMTAIAGDRARGTASPSSRTLPGAPRDLRRAGRSASSAPPARFSFYPTKNLGALGDGGAVIDQRRRARRRASGGCATAARRDRYHHDEFGVNSRLDEMQAAILRARLPRLPAWTTRRRALAARYRAGLTRSSPPRPPPAGRCVPPERDAGHVYHLFPVLSGERDALQARLDAAGIETLIHYPVPIPRQPARGHRGTGRLPRRQPDL